MSDNKRVPLKAYAVGIGSINPFCGHMSASRETLLYSQLQQKITIKNPDVNLDQSSLGSELTHGTFATRVPADCKVLAVHKLSNANATWRTCILYREIETGIIGHIELRNYHSLHTRLGYSTVTTPITDTIKAGTYLYKDAILDDSPGVRDGIYCYGRSLNTAIASWPSSAEDAYTICEDVLDDLKYDTIEEVKFKKRSQQILLHIYGDENNPKLIPEPGDVIREDNIIAAIRTIDPAIAVGQTSPKNIRNIDYLMDDIYELQSGGEGVVVDISVIRDVDKKEHITNTVNQLDKLADQENAYYTKILTSYRDIVRSDNLGRNVDHRTPSDVECTDITTAFLVKLSMLTEKRTQSKDKIKLENKGETLSPYTVTLWIKKTRKPNMGGKMSELSASKGVICDIWPSERMPVDENGVRADVLIGQTCAVNRNIVSKLYAQHFDHVAYSVARHIAQQFNLELKETRTKIRMAIYATLQTDPDVFGRVWEYMLGMYKICSPKQYQVLSDASVPKNEKIDYVITIIHYGGAIITKTVDDLYGNVMRIMDEIQASCYDPKITPVTYIDHSNKRVTTKNPIRISPVYTVLLERDASETSATDTIRLQSQLYTAAASSADKWKKPLSSSNVTLLGIDETIILSSALTPEGMAEFVDRLASPKTHAHIVKNILRSHTPTGHENIVDRSVQPLGTGTAIRALKHTLAAYGVELKYTDSEK